MSDTIDSLINEVKNLGNSIKNNPKSDKTSPEVEEDIKIPEKKFWHISDWATRQDELQEAILKAIQALKLPEVPISPPTVPTPPPIFPTPPPVIPPGIEPKLDTLIGATRDTNDMLKRVKDLTYWGLPKSENWAWLSDTLTNKVISPKSSLKLWQRKDEMGFATSLTVSTNNPALIYKLKLDYAMWSTSITDAWNLGFRDLGFKGVNVVRYDDIAEIYSMYYLPSYPGDPYRNTSWIEVENPTSSPITIYYGEFNRIILKKL